MDYANERLAEFKKTKPSFDEFEFCEPEFMVGNCLLLNSGCQLYDRVYVGAACPPEHEGYMKNLIKVGGVLVMPLNERVSKCNTGFIRRYVIESYKVQGELY